MPFFDNLQLLGNGGPGVSLSDLIPVAEYTDRANPFVQMGRVRGEGAGGGYTPPPKAANTNTSQAEIKASIQPLSLKDRNWQNYGSNMHPDEVLTSEPVWGGARRLAEEKGIPAHEAFADLANDLWQRMGANRYISPEMAKSYMRIQRGEAAGISSVK